MAERRRRAASGWTTDGAPMTGRALFERRFPLLAAAYYGRLAELEQERRARLLALEILQAAEYRVAHRELQFARACNRSDARRYQDKRWRKLQDAYKQLEEARERAEALGLRVVRQAA